MENLAGNTDCDSKILKELKKAGIDIVQLPAPIASEVPTSIIGQLPGFRFHRAWYYWVAMGEVPLNVAKELYHDPNGVDDIRVAGDCGCPPPEKYAKHYDSNGKELGTFRDKKDLIDIEKEAEETNNDTLRKIACEIRANTRYVECPFEEAAKSVIDLYHIDTQKGLNFFVTTLRRHGVIPSNVE